METLREFSERLAQETRAAYAASPFAAISRDCFSRYARDPDVIAASAQTLVDHTWRIVIPADACEINRRMTGHLAEFLDRCMGVPLRIEARPREELATGLGRAITLLGHGGGSPAAVESFTIAVAGDRVQLTGADPQGLRDAVVKLVDLMGMCRAPILNLGTQVYRPRLRVRLGVTPALGSLREAVFMGYNAVLVPAQSLFEIATSDAIPELAARRRPGRLDLIAGQAREARLYGLRTYLHLDTVQKFDAGDPIFRRRPELRGALVWKADGQHILCTEHPVVQRYLTESVGGIFRAAPDLDGLSIIIGGEGFYHCSMRPHGAPKGHTNCPRCEGLGPDAVVANLCNRLAAAVRLVKPTAEVVAWPYSAAHVWSVDAAQIPFIQRLGAGTSLLTEPEKDESITTPDGIVKSLWDYSAHLAGPGMRARRQISACRARGVPVYLKSEPELSFEAPRLPHVPCMDLWMDRAQALAGCGATGAWVFPFFRPNYASSAAEVGKHVWWDPAPSAAKVLDDLAARIAGAEAAALLRRAWTLASEALTHAPELPSYYLGPYYLGPAHPMCADPEATVPQTFFGRFLFKAESTDEEGLMLRPTFLTSPQGGQDAFGHAYRRMTDLLDEAAACIDAAEPLVPQRCELMFRDEACAIRWFYRTCRTHANFYVSCALRDVLVPLPQDPEPERVERAWRDFECWHQVLLDERENTLGALEIAEEDVRLNFRYGNDHSFEPTGVMLRAKLDLLDQEINEFLPGLQSRCEALGGARA